MLISYRYQLERAKNKLNKQHYKITCQRKDFLHKLSSKIVSENQTIIIEDLSVQNMLKNHCLAKSISSASWGEFFRQLQYKCDWNGKNLIKIGRFEPSTKICNECGCENQTLTLADREWLCVNCDTLHDRDVNAALNIKAIGLYKYYKEKYSRKDIPVEDVEMRSIGRSTKRQDFIKLYHTVNQ